MSYNEYSSYDALESAVAEEFEDKISELEERIVELLKDIDALKHEVDVAEGEAHYWEQKYLDSEQLRVWMDIYHNDLLTTFNVLRRLEKGE